jgi:xanthine/uracil permease
VLVEVTGTFSARLFPENDGLFLFALSFHKKILRVVPSAGAKVPGGWNALFFGVVVSLGCSF